VGLAAVAGAGDRSVHGVAFGGGFQLAIGADMRFSRPIRACRSWRSNGALCRIWPASPISRLVRDDILRDLAFTGRFLGAGGDELWPCNAHL
jgi:enoyl-CoA hydratase/carnithine racemase